MIYYCYLLCAVIFVVLFPPHERREFLCCHSKQNASVGTRHQRTVRMSFHYDSFHLKPVHTNAAKVHLSGTWPSNWGKNWLRDENGEGTVGCGSGWGCRGGLVDVWCRERGDAKTFYSAGCAIYVHYFKDIRQGRHRVSVLCLSACRALDTANFNRNANFRPIT